MSSFTEFLHQEFLMKLSLPFLNFCRFLRWAYRPCIGSHISWTRQMVPEGTCMGRSWTGCIEATGCMSLTSGTTSSKLALSRKEFSSAAILGDFPPHVEQTSSIGSGLADKARDGSVSRSVTRTKGQIVIWIGLTCRPLEAYDPSLVRRHILRS